MTPWKTCGNAGNGWPHREKGSDVVHSILWTPGAHAGAVVVNVEGELGVADAVTLREQLGIAADAWPHVVVNLARASFTDSSCLGVLVAISRRVSSSGGSLRLVVEEGSLLRTLRISGLSGVLAVYPTLDLAQPVTVSSPQRRSPRRVAHRGPSPRGRTAVRVRGRHGL